MSSLSPKDRVSLCLFSFTDGRRCRTPRTGNHPHFCFYHAQKEAQARAAESLAKDLATFFSGDYLSACDLNTALARLIPAVIRGEIKPRLARTVAYMVQTQLQAIHISQHEYINAFGADGWRKAVRASVNVNYDYRFPPAPDAAEPKPQQPPSTQSQRTHPQPQPPTGPSPQTPSRPQQPAKAKPQPPSAAIPSARTPQSASLATQPSAVDTALSVARSLFPSRPGSTPPQPAAPAGACHPERSEGPCLNPSSSTVDETRLPSAPAQSAQPNNTPPPASPPPQTRPTTPNRDPYAVHFDHNYRLRIDGNLF
jgi:hypothetical protein